MGRPPKEEILPRGPIVKISPYQYLYDKMKQEAESRDVGIATIAMEWLEATYDRRYGDEEDARSNSPEHQNDLHS